MRLPRRALSGGEIDPDLHYASDLAPVRVGAAKLRNFIARQRGGYERRPGTEYIGVAGSAAKIALREFRRSQSENYLVEWGPAYARVRDASAAPGAAYVALVTGYAAADLPRLNMAQSNDVQWVFSGKRVKELQRTQAGWAFVDSVITNGPFLDLDYSETRTLTASALTGAITLTASAAVFQAAHVGAYWRLEEQDFSATPKWQAGQSVAGAGARVRWSGNTYRAANAGTASSNPPNHTEGEEKDGTTGTAVGWIYEHSGFGIVQITGFVSATQVSATVIKRLPHQVLTGTKRWQEGAWSDVRGWPVAGALYKSALWAAGTEWQPAHLWKSAIDGFDNFEPGTTDDASIVRPLSSDATQGITWLASSASYLAIGAGGAEWIARPDRNGDTVRINNLITDVATTEGSSIVRGRTVNGVTIFPDASGTSLIGISYDYRSEGWLPEDLSLMAAHLLGAGVVETAWQRKPWPILWCLMADGKVAALTYQPAQKVQAWHLHDFGDPVETICVLPVAGGARETLFLGVRRGGALHIERMAGRFAPERGDTTADATYLDASVRYTFAPAQTVCAGLDHLEGRTVMALVDGRSHPPMVVTSGQVTLNFPGAKVVVGLPFESRWKDLPPDFGQVEDDQVSRRKRVSDIGLALRDTFGGQIVIAGVAEPLFRTGDMPLDTMPQPVTGIRKIAPPASDDAAQIEYVNDTAWPATLTALFPEYGV